MRTAKELEEAFRELVFNYEVSPTLSGMMVELIEDIQRDALDAAADGIEALHGEGKGATYASIGASYIRGLKP